MDYGTHHEDRRSQLDPTPVSHQFTSRTHQLRYCFGLTRSRSPLAGAMLLARTRWTLTLLAVLGACLAAACHGEPGVRSPNPRTMGGSQSHETVSAEPDPPSRLQASEDSSSDYDTELDPIVCESTATQEAGSSEGHQLRVDREHPADTTVVGGFRLSLSARWDSDPLLEGNAGVQSNTDPLASLTPLQFSIETRSGQAVWWMSMSLSSSADAPPDFTDGHGFTGLMTLRHPSRDETLQYWCERARD